MRPHGTIYQANKSKSFGEHRLTLNFGFRMAYHLLRTFGAGMVAFAIVGVVFSFWPIFRSEYLYRFGSRNQIQLDKFANINGKLMAEELGLNPYFSIYIPKINAKANIVPNVDAGSPKDYLKALTVGVAHAKGTNYPGGGKNIYLFSHSTDSPINISRYNADFYLLGKLTKGDIIIIYFMDKEYKYVVTDEFTTSADDTSWLSPTPLKLRGASETLVLQTCDPPGTTWRRLLVVAKPIK